MNSPMTGQEIASKLGVTRQAISNCLKKAMKKVYLKTRAIHNTKPFDTASNMMVMFNVGSSDEEVRDFFKLFPKDIREEIEKDASSLIRRK